jgi:hypothetical protein
MTCCGYIDHLAGRSREDMWRRRGLEERVYSLTPDMPPQPAVHPFAGGHPCTTMTYADALRRHGGCYERRRCVCGEKAYLLAEGSLSPEGCGNFRSARGFAT